MSEAVSRVARITMARLAPDIEDSSSSSSCSSPVSQSASAWPGSTKLVSSSSSSLSEPPRSR